MYTHTHTHTEPTHQYIDDIFDSCCSAELKLIAPCVNILNIFQLYVSLTDHTQTTILPHANYNVQPKL